MRSIGVNGLFTLTVGGIGGLHQVCSCDDCSHRCYFACIQVAPGAACVVRLQGHQHSVQPRSDAPFKCCVMIIAAQRAVL